MTAHPYPQHVMESVATAIFDHYNAWDGLDITVVATAEIALSALWEASRVDTVEQLGQLHDYAYIIDANGYWGDKEDYLEESDPAAWPMRVIYWGDSRG